MNLGDVHNLPVTLDAHQAADLFGCSYWHFLEQVREGTAPVEPLRLGRQYRFPTAACLRVVGIEWQPARDEGAVTSGAHVPNSQSPTPATNEEVRSGG